MDDSPKKLMTVETNCLTKAADIQHLLGKKGYVMIQGIDCYSVHITYEQLEENIEGFSDLYEGVPEMFMQYLKNNDEKLQERINRYIKASYKEWCKTKGKLWVA